MDPKFLTTTHGQLGCTTCHAGNGTALVPALAHQGLIPRPSDNPQRACGTCHPDIASSFVKGLHFTTHGQENGLRALTGSVRWPTAKPAYQKACASCHATCGDCHVDKPPYSNNPLILGGLQQGHLFSKTPPMSLTCQGCHGGRVAAEFTGQYEGFPADVHFAKANMTCTDCHPGAQMHGDGSTPANRFAVKNGPTCLSCHPQAAPGASKLEMHNVHGSKLSCQTCHGGISKSCDNCHAGSGATSRPGLKIGLNLRPELPFTYTLLRHVPTTPDMIDRITHLDNTLANFDRIPTWKTATPHSIQRVTARSQSCAACHNNPNLFLQVKDLNPKDSQANGKVTAPLPSPNPR